MMIAMVAVSVGFMFMNGLFTHIYSSVLHTINGSQAQDQHTTCARSARSSENMQASKNPQLRKLVEYEQVCGGVFVNRHMLFTATPMTAEESRELASAMAEDLKEFATHHVAPLVVLEPISKHDKPIDLHQYNAGAYDAALELYFQHLKQAGVTDEMMGVWVVMPEANTPMWQTTDPAVFSANVAKTVTFQKKYFPHSKASILLNSLSYPDHDETWQHGSFKSLAPYVNDLPHGLIDSFGYQGFPWSPPANEPDSPKLMKAKDFLRDDLAREAASLMGVNDIWVNTGTFRQSYVGQPGRTVTVSVSERQQILNDILGQLQTMQSAGFSVAVNLFAEDKSNVGERVDWSYWKARMFTVSDATAIFTAFVRATQDAHINFWLYDSAQ